MYQLLKVNSLFLKVMCQPLKVIKGFWIWFNQYLMTSISIACLYCDIFLCIQLKVLSLNLKSGIIVTAVWKLVLQTRGTIDISDYGEGKKNLTIQITAPERHHS